MLTNDKIANILSDMVRESAEESMVARELLAEYLGYLGTLCIDQQKEIDQLKGRLSNVDESAPLSSAGWGFWG